MEISISTLPYYPQTLEDILDHIIELEIGNCEIINEYPHKYFDFDIINSYDIKYSIHAPLSDINPASHNEAIRKSSIEEIKKSMDLASELDSDIVVVHPGYIPILGRKLKHKILEYNRNSLRECSIYAQEVGVLMCVENMPDIESLLYKNLDDLESLIIDLDAYITLDVGHAHNNSFTVDDILKKSRIKHIHLSDNDGSFDSHQALGKIGSGKGFDFKSLFKGLKKISYDEILVIEVEEPSDVVRSLHFLEDIL